MQVMTKTLALLAVSTCFGLMAQAPVTPPKPPTPVASKVDHTDATPAKPLTDDIVKDFQIVSLQMQITQRSMQDLQQQQNDLIKKACDGAGFKVDECSIDLQRKLVTKMPPGKPALPPNAEPADLKK
jgi:hypothetical protein